MLNLIENGNIFNSKMQTLVNPVNMVGVMGSGLAKSFKDTFHEMFEQYKAACKSGRMQEKGMFLWRPDDWNSHWVLCFPTKNHWSEKSHLRLIERGLEIFVQGYAKTGITSAAFPALGCGLGGLRWKEVGPLMTDQLMDLPIEVEIYLPREL